MDINLTKDNAITLFAWLSIVGLFFVLSGKIGEMKSDIKNLKEDVREIRQILISHLEFHAGESKVSSTDGKRAE